jgi:ABC-2 type transport system permease protein
VKPAEATRLVAGREISERLRGRATWIMTAVTALGVVLLIVIPALVRGTTAHTRVGLVGPAAQALGPALRATAAAARVNITVSSVREAASARSAVRDGSLDVALSIGTSAVAEVKQSLAPAVQAILQETVDVAHERQVLTQAGVPPATIGPAMRPVPFATSAIQPPPAVSPARRVAALASAILMFVTLSIYGTAIANGVAQEKTTRTAEVLLAMVRPRQLLFGKVTGIGTCALVQVGIAVGAGLIANAFTRDTSISSTTWALLPAVLLWFLLGFALYSFAYAAAGAIVARQEEVQFVVVPMALLNVGSYLLLFAMMASPRAPWVRVLSFLPPFAPTFMSARIALGVVSPWEVLAAALVMLVAIYGAARLVGRIYAAALVHGGARLSWGAALRLREI